MVRWSKRGRWYRERMSCFRCYGQLKRLRDAQPQRQLQGPLSATASNTHSVKTKSKNSFDYEREVPKDGHGHIAAQTFTFRELAAATKNFRPECLIGEGGFGRVYKGRLETGQVVAVKQLDRNGLQGNREFLVEVLMLSLLHHPNLVNLIGYCADGDQRLLVYEYMPLGSLEDHLHDLSPDKVPLDWNTRMKIAAGAAKGLEYLHDKANPPVIYRDLKSSNILLGEAFHPKLSDFGLAKLGPVGDKTHVSTRVMGTYGYCAPEYAMTGQLTLKSDVYSFGVVLLELITGRKAVDHSRVSGEHNLVAWAQPLFKDRRKFSRMADPMLQGHYPTRGLYQALAVAAMCLQEEAATRPLIGDVVTALSYLASQTYDPAVYSIQGSHFSPSTPSHEKREEKKMNSEAEKEKDKPSKHRDTRSHLMHVHASIGRRPEESQMSKANGPVDGIHTQECHDEGFKEHERYEGFGGSAGSTGRNSRGGQSASSTEHEQAVAEAKMWGESWREKKKGNVQDGIDGF